MAATVLPLMTANSYLGMAAETTYGTAASLVRGRRSIARK